MAELQARLTYTEFLEWQALYSIEPWGGLRADLRAAQQMALLANVNRDPKKRGHPYEAKDFLLDWWHEAPPVNDVLEKFRAISARINAHNAKLEN